MTAALAARRRSSGCWRWGGRRDRGGGGFATCFVIRALALLYGWSLPVYRAREGRTIEDVERLGK